jgi:parallel beta-helix repeat protein
MYNGDEIRLGSRLGFVAIELCGIKQNKTGGIVTAIRRSAITSTALRFALLASAAVAALLVSAASASATALPETISENMTLTAAGNPYTGNPSIKSGVTVNVEPGVKLKLAGLYVYGTLKVEGTAAEPVIFTGAKEETPGEWCHILFGAGSSASVIDHAELKYGGGCGASMIYVESAVSPTIINSTFRKSSSGGITVQGGGGPEIANNSFVANSGTGIYYAAFSTEKGQVNIHDNLIEGGTNGIEVSIATNGQIVGKNLGANMITGTTKKALFYKGPDIPGNITGNTLTANSQNVS